MFTSRSTGWHAGAVHEVFRPWFGGRAAVVIAAICAATLVALFATDGLDALPPLPWLALVAGACWAMFWRPEVAVDDGGVRLVNVLRTIDLPWPAILAIDTKWALTLITAYGRFTAWAAPAPGIHEAMRATKRDAKDLPESTFARRGHPPGDLPSSPSGEAAIGDPTALAGAARRRPPRGPAAGARAGAGHVARGDDRRRCRAARAGAVAVLV